MTSGGQSGNAAAVVSVTMAVTLPSVNSTLIGGAVSR